MSPSKKEESQVPSSSQEKVSVLNENKAKERTKVKNTESKTLEKGKDGEKKAEKTSLPSSAQSASSSERKAEVKVEKKNAENEKSLASLQEKEKTDTSKIQDPFYLPEARNGAKLCFVIDDGGLNINNVRRYAELPFPITVAILPKLSHSAACAYVVRSNGKEVILHQPMQSVNLNLDPGPGKISPDMTYSEIQETVLENLEEVGPVKGMNNHEGSLITSDALKIGAVLDVADQKGIYFIDSRTNVQTQAKQQALERDFAIFALGGSYTASSEKTHPNFYDRNAPFIDNVVSRNAMLEEIKKGLEVANRDGWAIMIAHVDKSVNILPQLLMDLYPHLQKKGYIITVPGQIR